MAVKKLVLSPPLLTPSVPDGNGNKTPFKPKSLFKNQFMSITQIKYDIGRKGNLDPHEELAQKRDHAGRENLSAEEAAALARDTLDLQEDKFNLEKEIRTLKRRSLWSDLLVSLFGIGTIVASIYAARSGKETHITKDGYLVSNTSG